MEGALRAGEALTDHLGCGIDENGHLCGLLHGLDDLLRSVGEIVGGDDGEARFGEDLLAEIDVGAFQANDQRHVQADLARRRDDALGDDVAAHDAPEDVDQDALDIGIGEDELEGGGHPLLGGAAADIEEVGGIAAIKLDDVHRRHGEAGAIDHAADIAVELDVVEAMLGRLGLDWILLRDVAHLLDLVVAEQRVVVEIHLGVEGDDLAVAGDNERVDLDDRGVELGEDLVHRQHELDGALHLLALEPEAEGELAGMEAFHPGGGIDRHLEDLVRMLGRDLLDLHAALGRGHHGDPRGRTVDQHAKIELALDVAAFLDIDALDLAAGLSGLRGDKDVAEHLAGARRDLVKRSDDADAALAA